nr:hypothetical protein [Streptomyces sp. 846.5]
MVSASAAWTDAGGEDTFVVLAAGRSPLRDLQALAGLIDHLDGRGGSAQEMTP